MRTIRWDALAPASSEREREVRSLVARSWAARAKQEHLAVGAFAMVVREVAAIGCDPVVLEMLTRAANDEVRHAEVCMQLSLALDGASQRAVRFRGIPSIPIHEGVTDELRALLHVVEMCCLSETLTGAYLAEMQMRATNPVAREVVASLLEDEIDHGRVGWAYLAQRHAEGALGGLEDALPRLLERTLAHGLEFEGPDDPEYEVWGYLGARATHEVFTRTLDEAIAPGFERVGITISRIGGHS